MISCLNIIGHEIGVLTVNYDVTNNQPNTANTISLTRMMWSCHVRAKESHDQSKCALDLINICILFFSTSING